MPKRILSLLSLVFGLLGVVICLVGLVGVWIFATRLVHTSEKAFKTIDDSLDGVQRRVSKLQERLDAAKITTSEIQLQVQQWATVEALDRLEEKLHIEQKAAGLSAGLQQAGEWLEFSESTVHLVEQALVLGNSLGVPVQAEPADRLQEELASLQVQLTEAIAVVQRVQERAAGDGLEEKGNHSLVTLLLRVAATLGTIDSRLDNFARQAKNLQNSMRTAGNNTVRWIRITAISFSVLICWMAAGQGALLFLGWKALRRQGSSANL